LQYADHGLCDSERERNRCGQGQKDSLEVIVDERAVDGRANKRLLEIQAEHFNIPKSGITSLKGARDKMIPSDSCCTD
jgi:uncharacterized protein YggU (UPF0235/DUF167 family)